LRIHLLVSLVDEVVSWVELDGHKNSDESAEDSIPINRSGPFS
jgi:hypothetical protein